MTRREKIFIGVCIVILFAVLAGYGLLIGMAMHDVKKFW